MEYLLLLLSARRETRVAMSYTRVSRERGAGSKKRACTFPRDVLDVNEELLLSSSALHQIRADTYQNRRFDGVLVMLPTDSASLMIPRRFPGDSASSPCRRHPLPGPTYTAPQVRYESGCQLSALVPTVVLPFCCIERSST